MKIKFAKIEKDLKKLKKYYKNEYDNYTFLLEQLFVMNNFNDFLNSYISRRFKYEKLKSDLSGFDSFNLCLNRGEIRLIGIILDQYTIEFIFISFDHYEDFKRYLKNKGGL